MNEYTEAELVEMLNERDAELKRHHRDIAGSHDPEAERQQEIEKIEKRREEVRFIKRLVAQNAVREYPVLPESWEGPTPADKTRDQET